MKSKWLRVHPDDLEFLIHIKNAVNARAVVRVTWFDGAETFKDTGTAFAVTRHDRQEHTTGPWTETCHLRIRNARETVLIPFRMILSIEGVPDTVY